MTISKPEDGLLGQLHAAVLDDDPDQLTDESTRWLDVATALSTQAGILEERIDAVRSSWTSEGSEVYLSQLSLRAEQLRLGADTAVGNGESWKSVADAVSNAKIEAANLMSQWEAVKAQTDRADWENARLSYDVAANALIATTTAAASRGLNLRPTEDYQPMPAVDLPGDVGPPGAPSGSGPDAGGGPGLGGPGSGSAPSADGGYRPPGFGRESGALLPDTPGLDPTGPDLQGPGTPPVGQLPGAPGQLPGGPGISPIPGAPPPPVFPGPGVPPPMSGRPVLPPPRPASGLGPGAGQPNTPRPPQSTVRPVIGARPGTTGMAPTGNTRPSTPGFSRPVIGARPATPGAAGVPNQSAVRPATGTGLRPGSLPGGAPVRSGATTGSGGRGAPTGKPVNGHGALVAERHPAGTRAPRPHLGGDGRLNRSVISGVRQAFGPGASGTTGARSKPDQRDEAEPAHRPEGGDYIWRVEAETVPAVIGGGEGWDNLEHPAEAVPDLSAPAPERVVDEASIVDRLARRPAKTESGQALPAGPWNTSSTTPAVIRPTPQSDDFGFRW